MIKLIRHLWEPKEDGQNWLKDLGIDGKKLDFYAPYEDEEDIYHFKIGDILRDTYTDQDYRAVEKIKKKSRWGEERDVFILKSLKTDDQFGLEHSSEGFGGLRYHKKYRLLFSQEDWVGYVPLKELLNPITRANKEESVLPATPGILFFYDQEHQLQYMEKTRDIKESVYTCLASDDKTAVHSIRHLFHFLCYVKREDREERSALYYYFRNRLKPRWDQKSVTTQQSELGPIPGMDRYQQILRFSLTVEDLLQYLHKRQLEASIEREEIEEMVQFMASMEKKHMEELIEQVLAICLNNYQKRKCKDSVVS